MCREPDGSLQTPLSLVRERLQKFDTGTANYERELELNALFDSYMQHYWKLCVRLRVFGPINEHLLDLHLAPYVIGEGILSKKRS